MELLSFGEAGVRSEVGMRSLHSHYPGQTDEEVILQDVNSIGVHPWYAGEADEEVINNLVDKLQGDVNHLIKAIGECGLDKLCTVPIDKQIEVFRQQVLISEQFRLPLIIHCVKAMDELLQIRRELSPTLPWIWHGFRGKPQQLQQLINKGFYVSFGFKYNRESLKACPLERMFLETDDDPRPVQMVYEQVCKDLCITKKRLVESIAANYQSVFVKG